VSAAVGCSETLSSFGVGSGSALCVSASAVSVTVTVAGSAGLPVQAASNTVATPTRPQNRRFIIPPLQA
ncbi:MAG: hypothetical protein ACTMIB_03900, partial [Cellulosimicrobium funkei]